MVQNKQNSPLLGYNTNVKHDEKLFHIQTEDSGVEHPHIITHLFTEGTILATKKTSYKDFLGRESWEDEVRQLMKDQHKSMFVELRDGAHDVIAARILGVPVGDASPEDYDRLKGESEASGEATPPPPDKKPAPPKPAPPASPRTNRRKRRPPPSRQTPRGPYREKKSRTPPARPPRPGPPPHPEEAANPRRSGCGSGCSSSRRRKREGDAPS